MKQSSFRSPSAARGFGSPSASCRPAEIAPSPSRSYCSPVICRKLSVPDVVVHTGNRIPVAPAAVTSPSPASRPAASLRDSHSRSSPQPPQNTLTASAEARDAELSAEISELERFVRESAVAQLNAQEQQRTEKRLMHSRIVKGNRPPPKDKSPPRPWGSRHPVPQKKQTWPEPETAEGPEPGSIASRGYTLMAYLPAAQDGPWPPLAHSSILPGKVTIVAKESSSSTKEHKKQQRRKVKRQH